MYDVDFVYKTISASLEQEVKNRLCLIQKYFIIKDLSITFLSEDKACLTYKKAECRTST